MLEGLLFGLIEEQPDPELDEIAKRHGLQMGTAPDEMELLHALGRTDGLPVIVLIVVAVKYLL